MHRERKKDIAVFSLTGTIIISLAYVVFGWLGMVVFLALVLASFGFMPPEWQYMERDRILAKRKSQGVQTIISEYISEEEESNET